jgi:hypothetical protein
MVKLFAWSNHPSGQISRMVKPFDWSNHISECSNHSNGQTTGIPLVKRVNWSNHSSIQNIQVVKQKHFKTHSTSIGSSNSIGKTIRVPKTFCHRIVRVTAVTACDHCHIVRARRPRCAQALARPPAPGVQGVESSDPTGTECLFCCPVTAPLPPSSLTESFPARRSSGRRTAISSCAATSSTSSSFSRRAHTHVIKYWSIRNSGQTSAPSSSLIESAPVYHWIGSRPIQ